MAIRTVIVCPFDYCTCERGAVKCPVGTTDPNEHPKGWEERVISVSKSCKMRGSRLTREEYKGRWKRVKMSGQKLL